MRSSPFDDDDATEEEIPQGSTNSLWRRPWWRWNLFTLFAVLFVYVWVRELLSWTAGITFLGLMAIFIIWILVPVIPNLLDRGSKVLSLTSDAIKKHRREAKSPKYILILSARWLAAIVIVCAAMQLVLTILTVIPYLGVGNNMYSYASINIWHGMQQIAYGISSFIFNMGLSIVLWMLADILQNQEEMKLKQQDMDKP